MPGPLTRNDDLPFLLFSAGLILDRYRSDLTASCLSCHHTCDVQTWEAAVMACVTIMVRFLLCRSEAT